MIAAIAILCQDQRVQPLVALVQRLPLSPRVAGLALDRCHPRRGAGPLRRAPAGTRAVAASPRSSNADPGSVSGELLSSHDAVDAAVRLRVDGAGADPLDEQLLFDAPWAQVAKVDRAAARALESVLPTKASWEDDHPSFRRTPHSGVRSEA